MKESARYAKIVEWSEEDQCYVGSSPGLVYGGCHGTDEKAVFEELCRVVEEAIALYTWRAGRFHQRPRGATSRTRCKMSRSSLRQRHTACCFLCPLAFPRRIRHDGRQ